MQRPSRRKDYCIARIAGFMGRLQLPPFRGVHDTWRGGQSSDAHKLLRESCCCSFNTQQRTSAA